MRRTVSKSKIVSSKRSPRHEGRAGALATIFAMAMRNIVKLAACFIADPAAQTTSVKNVCRHLKILRPAHLLFQIKRARAEIDDAMVPFENFGAQQPGHRRRTFQQPAVNHSLQIDYAHLSANDID